MKKLILLLLCIPFYLQAQLQIDLPSEITIFINDSLFTPSLEWNDTLVIEASSGKIRYRISSPHHDTNTDIIETKIKIPQILSLREVVRQVILYYALLNSEEDRHKERIFIYPYFTSIDQKASISCSYRIAGKYYIYIDHWKTVPIPDKPIPEHKEIFNQIMETSFKGIQLFAEIPPDEVLNEVAKRNNMDPARVIQIYKNVILWQLSQ